LYDIPAKTQLSGRLGSVLVSDYPTAHPREKSYARRKLPGKSVSPLGAIHFCGIAVLRKWGGSEANMVLPVLRKSAVECRDEKDLHSSGSKISN
jgi:hypothetical protein